MEYGLIAALIAVAGIAAMPNMSTGVTTIFNNASTALDG